MTKLRVLLVDDHTLVRRGLRKVLEATGEIEIVGEVGDGERALEAARQLHPDVVLMDVSLPDMNGIEVTRRIRLEIPDMKVLMLSMHRDDQYVRQSLAAGARGYLLKDADDRDLFTALTAVCHGKTCLDTTLGQAVLEREFSPDVLSAREREILALICGGRTNRDIATTLGLSIHTVETHRRHIIEKLDLHSPAELVRYAMRHGMLDQCSGPH